MKFAHKLIHGGQCTLAMDLWKPYNRACPGPPGVATFYPAALPYQIWWPYDHYFCLYSTKTIKC